MSTDTPRPNLVLIARRQKQGWSSRRRAARELHRVWRDNLPGPPSLESLEKALYRHETGRSQVQDDGYRKLYCLAYQASPHELFGSLDEPPATTRSAYEVRSHKFIPAFVGVEACEQLLADMGVRPASGQWLECQTSVLTDAGVVCQMYVWRFGVVIFHLVEDLAMPSLAAFAIWRERSYKEKLAWATGRLRELLPDGDPAASYVLGMHWIGDPPWSGETLDTALRILCTPKVLLDRDAEPDTALAHAEMVERALLVEGFDDPGSIRPFGVKGVSMGFASWAGVVYLPRAATRALTEAEMVACELSVQAAWMYCEYINGLVEQGRDPAVSNVYGWRFLRAVRSRLVNDRPQEVGQHRSMRQAILETSGILTHATHAIETLRDLEEG